MVGKEETKERRKLEQGKNEGNEVVKKEGRTEGNKNRKKERERDEKKVLRKERNEGTNEEQMN